MSEVRPAFKYALYAAIVVFVVGVCVILTDINGRLGELEHAAAHQTHQAGHGGK